MAENTGQEQVTQATGAPEAPPSPYGMSNLGRRDDTPVDPVPAQPTPEQPTQQGEPPAGEAQAPEPKAHDFDKGLSKTQQRVAALEKTVTDGFSKLEQLMARFQANPTPQNKAAVEQQAERQADFLAEIGDEDLVRGSDVKKALRSVAERVDQLGQRYEQTAQTASQMAAAEAMRTAQSRFLGEYPGLTGQDFTEGLQTAVRSAEESYPDFHQWPSSAKDAYLSTQLRSFGEGRRAGKAAPAPTPEAPGSQPPPPPKTAKGTTNVLKGATGRSAPSPAQGTPTSREAFYASMEGKQLSRSGDD